MTLHTRRRSSSQPFDFLGGLGQRLDRVTHNAMTFEEKCAALTIKAKDRKLIPLNISSPQKVYWDIRSPLLRAILLKYRQGGFTTIELADSHIRFRDCPYSDQVFVADTSDKAATIFRIASRFYENDPLAPALLTRGRKTRLESVIGSQIQVATAGGAAPGRGQTLDKVHGSEVPYWPGKSEEIRNTVAGFQEAAGAHGSVILEGTPNGRANYFYELWQEPGEFTKVFIPWFRDPQYSIPVDDATACEILETLEEDEKSLIIQHNVSIQQIAWRRLRKRALGPLFAQEYPEDPASCFLMRGTPLYTPEALASMTLAAAPVVWRGLMEGAEVERFVREPVPGMPYFMGIDFAKSVDLKADFNAYSVRDTHGFQVEAARRRGPPEEWGRFCVRRCEFWNRAMAGPEENNMGRSGINTMYNECKYTNIVRQRRWDGFRWVETTELGWLTTGPARDVMLRDHSQGVNEGIWQVNSRMQLEEMATVVLTKTRFEGVPHDDLTMSDCIAKQLIQFEAARGPLVI